MPTKLYMEHQEFCDKRSEVVCEENRIQYKLMNSQKHEIAKIKVDGGVFTVVTNEYKKCDYLVVDCEELFGILVELKGSNFQKAIHQIDSTLDLIRDELKKHQIAQIHGRIAMRQTPKHTDLTSNAKMRLDSKLKKHFGNGTLKIAKSPFQDSM